MTDPVYSPIALLSDAIAASPFNMAPEKAAALKADLKLDTFELVLSDDPGFSIRVNISTKAATLPVFALEYMWCFSLMILALSDEYAAAQRRGDRTFNCLESPRVSEAMELLNWAYARMNRGDRSPWPQGSLQPVSAPAHGSVVHAANEVFLCALAWIIHHEIAHVRLEHGIETTYSTQQENQADAEATNWIFSAELSDAVLTKRQLGMAVALLAIQFLEAPRGNDSKIESHPPTVERIHRCFEIARVPLDGIVRAATAVAVQLQLANLGIEGVLDGDSWDDIMTGNLIAFVTAGR
ncbi:phage exclusion protein Lit family protein [Burkholderia gladioli]|uniref:phage exclusion protein Lit family protein n=1 Tax=Burkholderia gladioli TaxID=28095 RepID=UPI00163EF0F3|nr:phage exclusion protein Lit family protein [Burkholderia gladioli]